MTEKIIIAGTGGQGIMLLGKVMAEAALKENKCVTWFPSYGAEVRGGTAHCMVVISDEEICSPYIAKADILLVMNAPSQEKFKSRLKNQGLLLLNSSLAKGKIKTGAKAACFAFTDIAIRLGNIKVANMVALGCLIAHKKVVSSQSIAKVIIEMAPKKELVTINQKALEEGMKLK